MEPDPKPAATVQRIFAEFLDGHGLEVIAEGLTADGPPAANDPARNRRRCGVAWAKSAVRVIFTNPRYTGRQVWNKQRKDEVVIKVEDVALGHMTKMRLNRSDKWVWSNKQTHERLVRDEDFERTQAFLASRSRGPTSHRPHPTRRPYALPGRSVLRLLRAPPEPKANDVPCAAPGA